MGNRLRFILFIGCLFITVGSFSQTSDNKGNVYVDDNGIMRWEKSNEEVKGFGVNYSVPFAHAFRSAKRMGIDPKEEIDNDVYHFTRLGFDLYRLHVWDTEISDTLGNLIENEQLDAFDYLLHKLKENNINYVITPIAFWGSGWPEPDPETPGFSHRYGKGGCLTDPACIEAQQNYLKQFLNHVNPYTGVAYKNDPDVIAIEVSNEPHHRGEAEDVTAFVKKMVDAIRATGTEKPIFYNISHAVHFAEAYFEAGIDGGTFQWYPTGLGYQRELPGNLLPNVNAYNIPFEETIKKFDGAKLVYEFDAADVGRSYIYPAMARSFRSAGIQIATHFAYDPTYLAYANTEYNTHYMNLVYTPQKALSLMITSKVFHEIPMYKEFVPYPGNTTFGNFRVDYKDDLALYNTESTFLYTNHTEINPENLKKLEKIAGYGNSPVVAYEGTGAYFLDKIDKGVWRLEVMPDAAWVDNPFGRNSPKKTVGVIKWNKHVMKIMLPDLGAGFSLEAINEGNNYSTSISGDSFSIRPGTYILSKKGTRKKWSPEDDFGPNKLKAFYAPETTVREPWFKHEAFQEITENEPYTVNADFIAPEDPEKIQIIGYAGGERITLDMEHAGDYSYSATIPADKLSKGYLNYYIIVKMGEEDYRTYPAGLEGRPFDWDFFERETYRVRVVPETYPIHLFDARRDSEELVRQWRDGLRLVPTENSGEAEYQVNIDKLFVPDNENLNALPVYDYTFKHFILDEIQGRKADLAKKEELVFRGRALSENTGQVQVAFVLDDGSAFGGFIELGEEIEEHRLSLNNLKPVATVTLPRPYPTFLPYYLEHAINEEFDINRVESLQISIGPGIPEILLEEKHGVGVVSIRLE
ncbi:MAG: cellulase family glycosylhydrolase [Candidatus Cyclobacteriaceae bacterium M2_1C_046]